MKSTYNQRIIMIKELCLCSTRHIWIHRSSLLFYNNDAGVLDNLIDLSKGPSLKHVMLEGGSEKV